MIIITHRISEVMQLADRVTVLRDGAVALSGAIDRLDEAALSEAMIGKKWHPTVRTGSARRGGEGLCLSDVWTEGEGADVLNGISLNIAPGEILGVAGVEGNGQKALAEAIIGLRRISKGRLTLAGNSLDGKRIAERRSLGLGYVSDDRHADGLILDFGADENMHLGESAGGRHHFFTDHRRLKQRTREAIDAFHIKTPGLRTPVRLLSGGNQQKLILARELGDHLRGLVICQPTRGLDIGASDQIRRTILGCRDSGCAILLISADLEELTALSDRIAVIYNGEFMGVCSNEVPIDHISLGLMMGGRRRDEANGCSGNENKA